MQSEQGRLDLPIAVIGAGPVGLAAAVYIRLLGGTPLVLEAGPSAGTNIRRWGHVRLFTSWRDVLDEASVTMLKRAGYQIPSKGDYPTGHELVDQYLEPLATLPELREHIRYETEVVAVSRETHDRLREERRSVSPFELVVNTPSGVERITAGAVIDASGTTQTPGPLGSNGLPANGEQELQDLILYGVPDVLGNEAVFAEQRVLVIGSGHSAQNVVLDLVELRRQHPKTSIIWGVRTQSKDRLVGAGSSDPIPERARLGADIRNILTASQVTLVPGTQVRALRRLDRGIEIMSTGGITINADRIIAATGFRPAGQLLAELRVSLDPILECPTKLAPLIDPRFHWCGSVPEHGATELAHLETNLFIVGMKSYGRAPTFLLKTGYAQVRSVAAAITRAPSSVAAATNLDSRSSTLIQPEFTECSANTCTPSGPLD